MAGTTNMQQWNPEANNQETDSEYTADSQRSGGATNPSVFASKLGNKLFYQVTTYLTAFMKALAAKGFTTSDSSLSTLTTQMANILTTADILPGFITVTFGSAMTFDASKANGFVVTLSGNVTSLSIINAVAGQEIDIAFIQDTTGGRTVAYPSNVFGGGQPEPIANCHNLQRFKVFPDLSIRASGPVAVS